MLNEVYTQKSIIQQIHQVFKKEGKVILFDLLEKSEFTKLRKQIGKLKFTKDQDPLSFSYSRAKLTPVFNDFFKTHLQPLLSTITTKKMTFTAFSFTWKDYTILNDNVPLKGVDIIFDLADFPEEAGGDIVYKGKTKTVIPPKANSLIIVRKNKEQRYIQYVNHMGKGKKRIFLLNNVGTDNSS